MNYLKKDQQKLPIEAWGRGRGRGKGKNETVQAEPGASNTGPAESMVNVCYI